MPVEAAVPLDKSLADVAWMISCAALVMLMQGGFCFLESGLGRAKNSINIAIKNLIDFCVSVTGFWVVGFGLMFGPNLGAGGVGGLVGTPSLGPGGDAGAWLLAFFVFQVVFCGTSTTIISGAIAERTRFGAYLLICVVVSVWIYPVFGHWAWGGVVPGTGKGWLAERGFVDFAGSSVVHSVGGWVALAAAVHVGPRIGRFTPGAPRLQGHNLPMATLGAMLLWFGWFGFNGGSTLAVNGSIPLIVLNTNLGGAAGGLSGLALAAILLKRADVGAVINGCLAGLVSVTAGCHSFEPGSAILVGAAGGFLVVLGERLLERVGIDDVVGAVPVHAFCGVWGTLAVGMFGDLERLGTGLPRWEQIGAQGLGVTACFGWAFAGGFVTLGLIRLVTPLRVDAEAERRGLNISEHGASTELIDLLSSMDAHRERGDFAARVAVEPHTEVGQIAAEYNRVLARVSSEISEREAAAEAARQAEEKYRDFFENAVEGIFRTTPGGRYLSANPALARIYGFGSAAELVDGLNDISSQLYVDDGRREEFVRRIEDEGIVTAFESRVRRRDGGVIWISETARAVRDDAGALLYYEGTVEDVTQRKLAGKFEREKEAAQARDRAKSAFLANMSHEIRTPLNGVIGMLNLLADGRLDERQARFVRIARQSADSLLSLINDILDFSKIEAGKLELERVEFDLHELLENVAEMFGHRAAEKGVELTCFVRPGVPAAVLGDPERLRQILVNVTGNAIKFTERGEVRIAAELVPAAGGDRVRLSVGDSGIGIPADRVRALFSPFTQVDASTTRKYGGTGLGLAICRQLAQLMGGEMGVESEVGRGSTFWCEVPLPAVGDGAPRQRRLPERLQDLRILAVDDNATNRELLQEQLSVWGFFIKTCADPFEALGRLSEAASAGVPFRLLLLDHQMPGLDGVTLAKRVMSDPALRGTAMLLLTSIDRLPSPEEQAAVGLAGAMTKPLRQSRLFDAIVDALHGPKGEAGDRGRRGTGKMGERSGHEVGRRSSSPAGRILVAEDNETNQLVTTELLKAHGYSCEVAGNGRQALFRLAAEAFDLVLMDCQMPEVDGFEATRRLREMESEGRSARAGRTPVVALTANAIAGDRERCLAAGMDDYVTKPIDPTAMLATVAKHLAPTGPAATPGRPAGPSAATDDGVRELIRDLTAEPADEPLDRDALLARCLGDEGLAEKVLGMFVGKLPQNLRRLEITIRARDHAETRRLAHALKGSAANVAAGPVARVAAEIERLTDDANHPDVEVLLGPFERLLAEADRLTSAAKGVTVS